MTQRRARKLLVRLGKLALAVLLCALCFEAALRFLLFSDTAGSWSLAQRLRSAGRFADFIEDEYWILNHRFHDPDFSKGPTGYDEQLGWVGASILPKEYLPKRGLPPGDRRPILLYGDSFAQCTLPSADCFEGLVQRSPLATRYALVNYGVGGYGLDQIHMLLQRTIDDYADRDPLVLFSLLVDGDLDRCLLNIYGCSKPRLVIDAGKLRSVEARVPRCEEFLARATFRFPFLAARLLIFDTDWLPRSLRDALSGREAKQAARNALARKLLEEAHLELERRGLRHAFVLFYTERSVRNPAANAAVDQVVRGALTDLGAPWLDMREALLADSHSSGRPLSDYYDQIRPPMGHPTLLGNQVMLEAMLAGLERLCGLERGNLPFSPANIASFAVGGEGAVARYSENPISPFPDGTEFRRLILRVGPDGPSEIHYELDGSVLSFRCTVRTSPFQVERGGNARMRLRAFADGEELDARSLAQDEPRFDWELSLAGKRLLVISLDDAGDGFLNDALVLCDPQFR